jgi:hypothetical protein
MDQVHKQADRRFPHHFLAFQVLPSEMHRKQIKVWKQ